MSVLSDRFDTVVFFVDDPLNKVFKWWLLGVRSFLAFPLLLLVEPSLALLPLGAEVTVVQVQVLVGEGVVGQGLQVAGLV